MVFVAGSPTPDSSRGLGMTVLHRSQIQGRGVWNTPPGHPWTPDYSGMTEGRGLVEVVEFGGVAVGDVDASFLIQGGEVGFEELLGLGPDAVGVGVV